MMRAALFLEKHFDLENNNVFHEGKKNFYNATHICIYVDGARFFFLPFL
jgi:hypothetical protein